MAAPLTSDQQRRPTTATTATTDRLVQFFDWEAVERMERQVEQLVERDSRDDRVRALGERLESSLNDALDRLQAHRERRSTPMVAFERSLKLSYEIDDYRSPRACRLLLEMTVERGLTRREFDHMTMECNHNSIDASDCFGTSGANPRPFELVWFAMNHLGWDSNDVALLASFLPDDHGYEGLWKFAEREQLTAVQSHDLFQTCFICGDGETLVDAVRERENLDGHPPLSEEEVFERVAVQFWVWGFGGLTAGHEIDGPWLTETLVFLFGALCNNGDPSSASDRLRCVLRATLDRGTQGFEARRDIAQVQQAIDDAAAKHKSSRWAESAPLVKSCARHP